MTGDEAARRAAERAARESYGKLLAYLAARSGDVFAAEDALADAFAAALASWPAAGVPRAPEAWLLVAARNRLIDGARRAQRVERLEERLERATAAAESTSDVDGLEDERLGLMFACAHPAIAPDVRGPLMLQTVLGLDAARIASAFLVSPAAMSQRLVRAKRKIARAAIPLRVPPPDELAERLSAVLTAVYATFVDGWGDPAVVDPRSRGLATEALWLGRVVVKLCESEPEATGLLALMLHANSRAAARRDRNGAYVPLDEQNPRRWNLAAIAEAEDLLARAARVGRIGRFQIEAALQSAHAVRRFGREPDWRAIVGLYDALFTITASPVVALNRAVAVARVDGARAGLAALDAVAADARAAQYQPYWAARADLLARAGDIAAARASYERAIGLAVDPAVRSYLATRSERLAANTLEKTVVY